MKKRSGASYRSKLLEPLDLFLDRALGNQVVAGILRREENVRVHVHSDHFRADEEDPVWLLHVAPKGWVILTKDRRIRKRALERDTLRESNAYAFILTSADLKGDDMAAAYVKALPQIRRLVARYHPPLVATVTVAGTISVL